MANQTTRSTPVDPRLRVRAKEVREKTRRMVRRARGRVDVATARAAVEIMVLNWTFDHISSRRPGWLKYDMNRAPLFTATCVHRDVKSSRLAGPLPLP